MNEEHRARARYTFGPLEQRGLVGSLRPTQTAILGAALLIILLVLVAAGRRPAGMLLAFAATTPWPYPCPRCGRSAASSPCSRTARSAHAGPRGLLAHRKAN
jgi:hypothetical protein